MPQGADHPLVREAPYGLCWKRSSRRRFEKTAKTHRELVVLHALTGSARYLIDDQVISLERGTLLWAFAGQAHFLLSESPDFDMWVFLISRRVLSGDLQQGGDFPPIQTDADRKGAYARRLDDHQTSELADIAGKYVGDDSAGARQTLLRWWLLRAWAHWRDADRDAGSRLHPALDRAAWVLRDDPNLSLRKVAKIAGLSAGRLGSLFRQQLGQSFVAYRNDRRLDQCSELLRQNPRQNLLTAALDAGFGSYAQFYRAFVDRYGVSPRDHFRTR